MTSKNSKVVNTVANITEGDNLVTQLADGHIESTVTQVSKTQ
ncbi:hypothetical protein [Pseudoalteromonas piratica]